MAAVGNWKKLSEKWVAAPFTPGSHVPSPLGGPGRSVAALTIVPKIFWKPFALIFICLRKLKLESVSKSMKEFVLGQKDFSVKYL